jgi:hypothetical protein
MLICPCDLVARGEHDLLLFPWLYALRAFGSMFIPSGCSEVFKLVEASLPDFLPA